MSVPMQDALANYFKEMQSAATNSAALLNPYAAAIQLAQLQANFQQFAAVAAAASKGVKRKADEDDVVRAESPLDLSGSPKSMKTATNSPFSIAALAGKNPLEQIRSMASTSDEGPRPSAGRQNARLTQWLSHNGPEAVSREIFKCVQCGEPFQTFQALTTHMQFTGHFSPSSPSTTLTTSPSPTSPSLTSTSRPSPSPPTSKRDLVKEQMPMPRKLVRGQDVWLGRGEEQTKHILKCIYCGQSFRSLDELTRHMQETKHYAKVMSHDQISSWKGNHSAANSSSSSRTLSSSASAANGNNVSARSPVKKHLDQAQVNMALNCKARNEAFAGLPHLTEHIVKNNHYGGGDSSSSKMLLPGLLQQSPISRFNDAAAGSTTMTTSSSKKAKSLPVKMLLEIERSRQRNRISLSPPQVQQQHSPSNGSSSERPESNKSSESSKSLLGDLEDLARKKSSPPTLPNASPENSSPDSGRKKNGAGPLAALQMLCENAEQVEKKSPSLPMSVGKLNPTADPSSILTFSWACMAADGESASGYKCRLCDTPFASKGAYRHHLSKVHFMKEGGLTGLTVGRKDMDAASAGSTTPASTTPQSKYQKYAELAKQLSSSSSSSPSLTGEASKSPPPNSNSSQSKTPLSSIA